MNEIETIDVSQNPKLVFFSCGLNNLEELDLSQNPNLSWIQCQSNENLNFLDIRNGENSNLSIMWANETPNLKCILVDNVIFADSQECGYPTSGWCIDENDIFAEDETSCSLNIQENTRDTIFIVPNPSDALLKIITDDKIHSISVFDIQGKLILQTNESISDISKFPTGNYLVKIITNIGQSTKHFIKR